MSLCDECPFEEKLLLCCPRFPETGEQTVLEINGERLSACPHMDKLGHCRIYDTRPRGCRDFECDRYRNSGKSFSIGPIIQEDDEYFRTLAGNP